MKNLQKTDINCKEGTISFKRTKTRTSHVINIPNTLKPILKDYIAFLPKNWIQNGYNQLELMRISGHSTLDMTNKYVNLYSNEANNRLNTP